MVPFASTCGMSIQQNVLPWYSESNVSFPPHHIGWHSLPNWSLFVHCDLQRPRKLGEVYPHQPGIEAVLVLQPRTLKPMQRRRESPSELGPNLNSCPCLNPESVLPTWDQSPCSPTSPALSQFTRANHFTCFICPELKSVINHSLTDQNPQSWVFWILNLLDPFGPNKWPMYSLDSELYGCWSLDGATDFWYINPVSLGRRNLAQTDKDFTCISSLLSVTCPWPAFSGQAFRQSCLSSCCTSPYSTPFLPFLSLTITLLPEIQFTCLAHCDQIPLSPTICLHIYSASPECPLYFWVHHK